MVWDMGSYERYCVGCIGWIWAGGFGVLLVDFVLRLVGDLCDFVWFCICDLNDVLYDFIGWFWDIFKNIGVNFEMLVENFLVCPNTCSIKWYLVKIPPGFYHCIK